MFYQQRCLISFDALGGTGKKPHKTNKQHLRIDGIAATILHTLSISSHSWSPAFITYGALKVKT
jgi:hypothetical protein